MLGLGLGTRSYDMRGITIVVITGIVSHCITSNLIRLTTFGSAVSQNYILTSFPMYNTVWSIYS